MFGLEEGNIELEVEPEEEGKEIVIEPKEEPKEKPEGKAKGEEHEPPVDSPRWTKVYRDWKEAERQLKEMKKVGGVNDSVIQEMRDHNKKLHAAVEKLSQDVSENKEDAQERELKNLHAGLLKEKKQAFEDGDYAKLSEVDDRIFDIKIQINEAKRDKKNVKPTGPVDNQPSGVSANMALDIANFKTTAPWFEQDKMMSAAAVETERELLTQYGKSKPYPELLEEVRKKVEDRFGYKKEKDPLKGDNVEGSSNVSGRSARKSVKLSQEEVNMANNLGVSHEDYAKQKLMLERVK